ncbi:MAG TPA: hypothetical protein ENH10_02915 [Bacteroidetes bacterium]|nr:sn-glycerol-3-phosphate dehydrogenase subunit C [bacterium BMS3Bbin04]HDO64967.1 hypothetical protein [Bacteroidota bacterium]HEX04092.1 hypothetical protein [Bacteroidota bacterium]
MGERITMSPDVEFIKSVQAAGGDTLKKCYQCSTCSTVCELSPAEKPFPRKEMLWAQWGMRDKLISDPDIWLCHQCNDCSVRCPRGAKPGDVLAAIRSHIYETFTYPRFMGKALASPAALPILLLIPMLIVAGLMFLNIEFNQEALQHEFGIHQEVTFSTFFNTPEVHLTSFVPAGFTEMLFITGNMIIFLIAAVGLLRFWKQLQHEAALGGGPAFVPSLIKVIVDILQHRRFGDCGQNKPRQLAHILVMYGFFFAAAAAGLALFRVINTHLGIIEGDWFMYGDGPSNLPNPIKFVGMFGGLGIFIGGLMMVVRRNTNADDVGANGYSDKLFLWMIFWVGTTGMLSWLLRWGGVPSMAYPIYYIHIVIVFFVLWYMPYSKFAHMLYRGLAMVWAEQNKREYGKLAMATNGATYVEPVAVAPEVVEEAKEEDTEPATV